MLRVRDGVRADGWHAEFRLLGPVEVLRDGRALNPLGPQPRTVLAMLLLGTGDVVSTDRLIDVLWGERPPDEPRNAIQVYVSRLRRLLSGAAGVAISTAGRHGYRMDAAPEAVDLLRFRRLTADARDADPARAVELLGSALSLWRGDPFGGAAGDWLHRQLTPGLHDERVRAAEQRALTLTELGRYGEATAELSTLLAEHPTREQLAEALMTALHRTGRTAEALAVFRDLRTRLVDDLGIEPGESARRVHENILAGTGEPAEQDADARLVVPAQLPSDVTLFVGRADVIPAIRDDLAAHQGDAPKVVALTGAGGTGKSALAIHLAHRIRDDYPDGQLYASLAGDTARPADPADVLADFLLALGVPAAQVPGTVEQRAALYRSMVARRRLLVVLDGATDTAQVRPLLPGVAGCAVVVTSRSRLAALETTSRVPVAGLSPDESVRVLTSILGEQRVHAEQDAAHALARHCGYLPLALRICAGRLTNRPQWRLAALAERLADGRARLDELQLGDLDIRASFTISYQQLDGAPARAFRLWSLARCGWLHEQAAAAMLGVERRHAESLADALIDLHLLELTGQDRLWLHDLLRQLGRELSETSDGAGDRDDALGRLAGWYAHTFARALAAVIPGVRRPRYLLSGAAEALRFDEPGAALEWLDGERANLAAVILDAAERSLLPPADLTWIAANFGRYAGPRGHLEQWRQLVQAAVRTAKHFGDKRSEARAMIALGSIAHRSYELDAAAEHLGWAAGAMRDSGETAEATAARNLALVYASLEQRGEVVHHLDRAYQLYRQLGDARGQASTLNSLGRQRIEIGDYPGALELFRQAMDLAGAAGAVDVQSEVRIGLADALRHTGDGAHAEQHYRAALDLVRGTSNRWIDGAASAGLARVRAAAGQPIEAAEHLERAVTAYRDGQFDFELALALAELGGLVAGSGQRERARACWQEAGDLTARLGAGQANQVRARVAEHSG